MAEKPFKLVAAIKSVPPSGGEDLDAGGFPLTDKGNGERFAETYGHMVRYIQEERKAAHRGWLVWWETASGKRKAESDESFADTAAESVAHMEDGRGVRSQKSEVSKNPQSEIRNSQFCGGYWRRDNNGAVIRLAKQRVTVEMMYEEVGIAGRSMEVMKNFAHLSQSAGKIKSMLDMASSEIPIAAEQKDFDGKWSNLLFNCQNATIDLATGEPRSARREDMMTVAAPVIYDPKASQKPWLEFLTRIQPDADMRHFLGKMCCYCLTADTSDRAMFLLSGTGVGSNGKSTFINVLSAVLGPRWSKVLPLESLLAGKQEAMDAIGRIRGARLVTTSETPEGAKLNITRLKWLTGSDMMSGQEKYVPSFDFVPTHKLIVGSNYDPDVANAGKAFLRRYYNLPFRASISKKEEKRDPSMTDILTQPEVLSGVLNWILEHREDWRVDGFFTLPPEMERRRREIEAQEDVVGEFIWSRYHKQKGEFVSCSTVYDAFKATCENQKKVLPQNQFGQRVKEMGFESVKKSIVGKSVRVYMDLAEGATIGTEQVMVDRSGRKIPEIEGAQ